MDKETNLPAKIETYIFDLDKWTSKDQEGVTWEFDHEMTSYYNLTDLRPSEMGRLSDSVMLEEEIALKMRNAQSGYANNERYNTCDKKCRHQLFCETFDGAHTMKNKCKGVLEWNSSDFIYYLTEFLMDPYYVRDE